MDGFAERSLRYFYGSPGRNGSSKSLGPDSHCYSTKQQHRFVSHCHTKVLSFQIASALTMFCGFIQRDYTPKAILSATQAKQIRY